MRYFEYRLSKGEVELDLHVFYMAPDGGPGSLDVRASLPGTRMGPVELRLNLGESYVTIADLIGNSGAVAAERHLRGQGIGTLLVNTAVVFLREHYLGSTEVNATFNDPHDDPDSPDGQTRAMQRTTFWAKHGVRPGACLKDLVMREAKVLGTFNAIVTREAFREIPQAPEMRLAPSTPGASLLPPTPPAWLAPRQDRDHGKGWTPLEPKNRKPS